MEAGDGWLTTEVGDVEGGCGMGGLESSLGLEAPTLT